MALELPVLGEGPDVSRTEGCFGPERHSALRGVDLSMDSVTKSPSLAPAGDMAGGGFLPAETPLTMVPCRFDEATGAKRAAAGIATAVQLRRLFVFAGTALLTAAGGFEMYDVLKVGGVTVLEGLLLVFFLVLLAW